MGMTRREMIAATGASLMGGLTRRPERIVPPRLIVRADDMGCAHSVNEAIVRCVTEGIATSVEVIAPAPWFPEATRMLSRYPDIDVGVHLALSSEWDLVKWRPLTEATSLRDADGYFYPMISPNTNYPARALSQNSWRVEDVAREFRAQIELARKHVPRLSHWSAHMGCTSLSAEVRVLAKELGKEYGIDIVPDERGVQSVSYMGAHVTPAEKQENFLRMLDTLQDGRTYLMVDHPGLDGPELRAIHHVGYENVAVDRQGVTDTWTNGRVRERIKERGIQLISYGQLKAQ